MALANRFDITDEGGINDYLGVKVTIMPDGTITLTQPHSIHSIISDLGFKENKKGKPTPAPSTSSINRPGPRQISPQRIMEVSVGHRKVEISGEISQTSHRVCSPSVRSVLEQPEAKPLTGGTLHCAVPRDNT
jgi:hypothetical protein